MLCEKCRATLLCVVVCREAVTSLCSELGFWESLVRHVRGVASPRIVVAVYNGWTSSAILCKVLGVLAWGI